MNMDKTTLRKKILAKRDLLNDLEIKDKSEEIIATVLETDLFSKAQTVMCYVSFRSEVDTLPLMEACIRLGKRLLVPAVVKIDLSKEIRAFLVSNLKKDLEIGYYGILEPNKRAGREVNPVEIDLVIVPGVAFDANGSRMGYGAGFYDRFLPKLRKNCPKVGVAFDLQIVDCIPVDIHDIPMDLIFTEKRVIKN